MNQSEIVSFLQDKFDTAILPYIPFPKAYCNDISKVWAIYLGCDPSNQKQEKFDYAFAIGHNSGSFKVFTESHEKNLRKIKLSWDKVYVQNLCQNYFEKETSKNLKIWKEAAEKYWINHLRKELDSHFNPKIPVLLTSQYLLEVLANPSWAKIKAPDFYEGRKNIPIPSDENKLNRPMIPMYRGKSPRYKVTYHLSNKQWNSYRMEIIGVLEKKH